MPLRFSIVIPNFNSGPVLERAIRSLLDQNYPDLQIILCDSVSADESNRAIIEKYRHVFDPLIVEKDSGQADGLNKGLAHVRGNVCGWLCADDELLPGALHHVAEMFEKDSSLDVVTGSCERVFGDGARILSPPHPDVWDKINVQCSFEQSATFWRSELQRKVGNLDTSYHLLFDWDLWNRFHLAGARLAQTDRLLSRYFFSDTNKTGSAGNRFAKEGFRIIRKYGPMRGYVSYVYRLLYEQFDLHGCFDKPPTCNMIRSHAFVATMALLALLIGRKTLFRYNWHFASCQQRNLKWW